MSSRDGAAGREAGAALPEGEAATAARLLGAGAALRKQAGYPVCEYNRLFLDRPGAAARQEVGSRSDVDWAAGEALTLDEAAALALREP